MPRFFPIFVLAFWAGLFCTGQGCTTSEIPRKIPKDTIVAITEFPARSLNPLFASDAISQKVTNLIYAALIQSDEKMRLAPGLAESWHVDGGKNFRFKLRANSYFHDGSRIEAQDVVAALKEYADPKSGSPHQGAFAEIAEISAPDKNTVILRAKRPQPYFLYDLPVARIFKRKEAEIVGSGPFKFVSQSPHEVRLERFEKYYVNPPDPEHAVMKLVFRYVPEDITRYQLFLRGDANALLSSLSLLKTEHLKSQALPNFKLVDSPGINVSYLAFNFRSPIFSKLKVRQAFAHAIDIPSIIEHRMKNHAALATGLLSQAHEDYAANVRRNAFDPKRAEKLLDEAGFPRKGKEGWRFQVTYKCTSEKTALDNARLITRDLRAIGVDARVQTVEIGTFFADIKAGHFQFFVSRWVGITNPSIYFRAFHSSQIGKLNRGGYRNPVMDHLLDEAMTELDASKRARLFDKIQKLAAEDLPYVNLWHWNNTLITTRDMGNIVMYPNGDYLTLADLSIGGTPTP